jgi:phosphatidylethanolamine-binding protein (PEBP) family uncharacterized protein
MQISYNPNPITLYQKMTKEATKLEPNVLYTPNEPAAYYTLIMYDPNAVTTANNYVHWVVTNIIGNDIKSGTHLLPYYGPHPPPGSGTHHYIFELFKQAQDNTNPINVTEEDRTISKKDLYSKLGLIGKIPEQTTYFIIETEPATTGGKSMNIKRKTLRRKKQRNNKKKTKRTTMKNKIRNKTNKK